jgi:hypothetical protein
MKRINTWGLAAAGIAAVALAGCAGPRPNTALVKDVIADPDGYMATFDAVPATTVARLPGGQTPVGFRRLELDYKVGELRTDGNGGVSSRPALTVKKVLIAGSVPGTIRGYDIWSTNGIPFRYNVRVSYHNLLSLKWQTVYVNRANVEPSVEVKTISRFDALDRPGSERARVSFTYGRPEQVAGFQTEGMECSSGAVKRATELHPELVGDFTELSCDHYGANGQVLSHSQYAYLQSYGVAIVMESHDTVVQGVYKLLSVRVDAGPLDKSQVSLADTREN